MDAVEVSRETGKFFYTVKLYNDNQRSYCVHAAGANGFFLIFFSPFS